jgi:hypothetical protein
MNEEIKRKRGRPRKITIPVKVIESEKKPEPIFRLDKEMVEVTDGVSRILQTIGDMPIFVITAFEDGEYDIEDVDGVPDDKNEALKMFNKIGQQICRKFPKRGIKGLFLAANVSFEGPFPKNPLISLLPHAELKAMQRKTAILIVGKDIDGGEKALLKTYITDFGGRIFFKDEPGVNSTPELAEETKGFSLMRELWVGYKFYSVVGGTNLTLLK